MAAYTYSYVPQYYYQAPMYYHYDQYNPYKGNLYQTVSIYDGSEEGSGESSLIRISKYQFLKKTMGLLVKTGLHIALSSVICEKTP